METSEFQHGTRSWQYVARPRRETGPKKSGKSRRDRGQKIRQEMGPEPRPGTRTTEPQRGLCSTQRAHEMRGSGIGGLEGA